MKEICSFVLSIVTRLYCNHVQTVVIGKYQAQSPFCCWVNTPRQKKRKRKKKVGNRPHWAWHALGNATEYGVINIGNFQKVFSFS